MLDAENRALEAHNTSVVGKTFIFVSHLGKPTVSYFIFRHNK